MTIIPDVKESVVFLLVLCHLPYRAICFCLESWLSAAHGSRFLDVVVVLEK